MSDDLQDLYQDIILDHNRRPRNSRELPDRTHYAEGLNPLCGDEVTINLQLFENTIKDITFQGQGCAISQASASLMTEILMGLSLDDMRKQSEIVQKLLTSENELEDALFEYGNLAALSGVRKFPARIKCATLAWHTLEAALKGMHSVSTEDDI
jgi:nitrogen fixation NifU-like protein